MRGLWRALHALVAASWLAMLYSMLLEIAQNGDLPRNAVEAGHYETSFVLFMTALLVATAASAIRALFTEQSS